jgi:hypothetical protein
MIARSTFFAAVAATVVSLAPLASRAAGDEPLLRDRTADQKPSLVVLGLAHFDNPARDAINVKIDDMLVPKRQKEIEALVDRLAAYKPTRIAVEYPRAKQAELDERYRAFRDGTYTLTRDETDQIGLRLAKKLGLERIDAADWNQDPPGKDQDYDFQAWANAHGQQDLMGRVFDQSRATREAALLARSTVGEYLCALDAAAKVAADNQVYFDLALIGDADNTQAAAWVGSWHGRNIRILNNLIRDAKPHDRVLAIFGAGHKYLLDEYARESNAFKVEDAERVMGCK